MVTNFRIRLLEDHVDLKGKLTHQARLEIAGEGVDLPLSNAEFNSPQQLLKAVTLAAVKRGLEYPIVMDPQAKRLLPELIKATQAKPPQRQPLTTETTAKAVLNIS